MLAICIILAEYFITRDGERKLIVLNRFIYCILFVFLTTARKVGDREC